MPNGDNGDKLKNSALNRRNILLGPLDAFYAKDGGSTWPVATEYCAATECWLLTHRERTPIAMIGQRPIATISIRPTHRATHESPT